MGSFLFDLVASIGYRIKQGAIWVTVGTQGTTGWWNFGAVWLMIDVWSTVLLLLVYELLALLTMSRLLWNSNSILQIKNALSVIIKVVKLSFRIKKCLLINFKLEFGVLSFWVFKLQAPSGGVLLQRRTFAFRLFNAVLLVSPFIILNLLYTLWSNLKHLFLRNDCVFVLQRCLHKAEHLISYA